MNKYWKRAIIEVIVYLVGWTAFASVTEKGNIKPLDFYLTNVIFLCPIIHQLYLIGCETNSAAKEIISFAIGILFIFFALAPPFNYGLNYGNYCVGFGKASIEIEPIQMTTIYLFFIGIIFFNNMEEKEKE